jgi:D-lactate dehydrogenase
MAKIALGLGMNVLCYSRTYKPAIDELGISFVTLDTLLKDADIIMPALPLTSKTKYLINHNNVTLVKKESIIINVARCEIIENKLYYELPNIIASDVCSDINLAKKESFLYTPHMAYYTQEALVRILAISLENMEQFIAGEIPINCLKIPCKKECSD